MRGLDLGPADIWTYGGRRWRGRSYLQRRQEFMVEFTTFDGATVAVTKVSAGQIRPLSRKKSITPAIRPGRALIIAKTNRLAVQRHCLSSISKYPNFRYMN